MARKLVVFPFLMLFLLLLLGCGLKTGPAEGLMVYITSESTNISAKNRGEVAQVQPHARYSEGGDSGDYFKPSDVRIGLDKIWFPTPETYAQIRDDNQNETKDDGYVFLKNPAWDAAGSYYKVVDAFKEYEASNSVVETLQNLPDYGSEYHGVVVDLVYYEFEMEDWAIRWYVKGHGTYEAKDVLIQTDTDPIWKFAYYHKDTLGDITFSLETERKSLNVWDDFDDAAENDIYFCVVNDGTADGPDGLQDGWSKLIDPVLVAGHKTQSNPDPLANPNTIWTFAYEDNEAQYYLFQVSLNLKIDFSIGRLGGLGVNPGIDPDQTSSESLSYQELLDLIDTNLAGNNPQPAVRTPDTMTSLTPVGGGIETRFGFIDFNGEPQGEFSPEAGWD